MAGNVAERKNGSKFANRPGYSLVVGDSGRLRWHKDDTVPKSKSVESFKEQWAEQVVMATGDVQGEEFLNTSEARIDAGSGFVDISGPVSAPAVMVSVEDGGEVLLSDVFAKRGLVVTNSSLDDVMASDVEVSNARLDKLGGNGTVSMDGGVLNNVEVWSTDEESRQNGLLRTKGNVRIRNSQVAGQLHMTGTPLHRCEVRGVQKHGLGVMMLHESSVHDAVVDVPARSAFVMVGDQSLGDVNFTVPEGTIAGVGIPAKYEGKMMDNPGPAMMLAGSEPGRTGLVTCPGFLESEFVYHEAYMTEDGVFEVKSTPFFWVSGQALIGDKLFDQPVADHINENFHTVEPINDHAVRYMNKLMDPNGKIVDMDPSKPFWLDNMEGYD